MKRTLLKTVTYRVMNGVYGGLVAYAVTGKLVVALGMVGAEAAYKMFAYFAHERVWETAVMKNLVG